MSVLDNFKRIAAIPRESGHEEGVRAFIVGWAASKGFECVTDKTGNVIIYCPATKGYENVPEGALQGHMDMVCVQRPGSKRDFRKDPSEIGQDGDSRRAMDASLGADDGVAIATTRDIFTE